MDRKPIIGIPSVGHELGFILPVFTTTGHYVAAVQTAGSVPVLLPVTAGADGFLPTAWATGGVVEAMEHTAYPVLGVQWHPENLAQGGNAAAQALFQWLVRNIC